MGNRYTEKANSEQSQASNEELLLQIMQQEYPNDPLFTNGELVKQRQLKHLMEQERKSRIYD